MSIKEHDIRPAELNHDKLKAAQQDLEFMLANKHRFVPANCPACHTRGNPCFEKNGFSYESCPQCLTVFVNPRPQEALLHEYYSQSKEYEYWNKYVFPASETTRRTAIFRPRVERMLGICKKHDLRTDALLEIGAGFGTFCEEVRSTGVFREIIALEMTADLAQTCRNRGLKVIESPVETLNITKQSLDVIASFETIEHLFDPERFLTDCRQYLRKGGLIVLSCPNYYGFDVLTLGPISDTIVYVHLNYFNPRSLAGLLERCGFKCLEILTPGELDTDIVCNKIKQGQVDLKNAPFLRFLLTQGTADAKAAFQNFLQDHLLSSHMFIAAQRMH